MPATANFGGSIKQHRCVAECVVSRRRGAPLIGSLQAFIGHRWRTLVVLVAGRRLYVSGLRGVCVGGDVRDCHWVWYCTRKREHLGFGPVLVYRSLELAGAMKGITFIL